MDYREEMLTLARLYSERTKRSLARIGTLVHNQGAFFNKLEDGKTVTVETYQKVLRWFSKNWPADLEWPAEIARPVIREAANEAAPFRATGT